jgi:3-oxoadipate enol-lactonase
MDSQETTTWLTIDGVRTLVRHNGSGELLVLVHGLGGPLIWQRVVPLLARRFRVLTVDLPGFGESGCPAKDLTTDGYARFLHRLLELMHIRRATIVGLSFGGQIAVRFADLGPHCVENLVLVNSTGLLPDLFVTRYPLFWRIVRPLAAVTIFQSRRLLCFLGRRSFVDVRTRPADLCAEFYKQISQPGKRMVWMNGLRNVYAGHADFQDELRHLSVPTLVISGECDRHVPTHNARRIAELVPDSQLVVIQKCAHALPLEQPELFAETITDFIRHNERDSNGNRKRNATERTIAPPR